MLFMSVIFTRFLGRLLLPSLIATVITAGVNSLAFAQGEEPDPPEITNGERLFLETRFAQFFKAFLDGGGGVNDVLPMGDPILKTVINWNPTASQADAPFADLSMNCRSCHFVDDLGVGVDEIPGFGMRTYTDFARRSPIPAREDGKTVTVRNSPPLVNASLPRKNFFLHFDAEFKAMVDLVKGTLTGRNFGYLPGEQGGAIAHIARVVREDNGKGDLAQEFEGIPYSKLLTGTDPTIPADFLLPEEFRVDVATASDKDLFHAVAKLISAYTENLTFSQDEVGNFNLSPYDVFLEINKLPRQPRSPESDLSYSQRLLSKIKFRERRGRLRYVTENPATDNGEFLFHDQPFVFGKAELRGLKIFFAQESRLGHKHLGNGEIGNCIACHAAPNFTDFKAHNTGITQAEYDEVHGDGQFAKLKIPGLKSRNRNPNKYLPATEKHPHAKEPFRAIPSTQNANLTDLGLWNIFLNPDFPRPQQRIFRMLCEEQIKSPRLCIPSRMLKESIALFKTPGLRDLSHGAPYFHNGQADTFEDVIASYIKNSALARQGRLRNGDPRLKNIALTGNDIKPLAAFLRALNEDYE